MDLSESPPRLSKQAVASATDYKCDSCGNLFFSPVFMLKKVSALMSPNGREVNFPVQTFGCAKCGHVNEEFIPKVSE